MNSSEAAQVERLRGFGRVQRRNSGFIGRRMLEMQLPAKIQKRRHMDAVGEDIDKVEVRTK